MMAKLASHRFQTVRQNAFGAIGLHFPRQPLFQL